MTSRRARKKSGGSGSIRLGRALAIASSVITVIATLWLYFGSNDEAILPLLLEMGPRWVLILGLVPLAVTPMAFRGRLAVWAISIPTALAITDFQLSGCLIPAQNEQIALRVGTYNTGGGFIAPTELLLWYDEQRLDLLLLQELYTPEPLQAAAAVLGMDLLCKSRLCAISQHRLDGGLVLDRRKFDGWGGYAARFEVCTTEVCTDIVNLHLATPRHAIEEVLGRASWEKARGFLKVRAIESNLASLITRDPGVLIAGDFNMTQQSPLYRDHWSRWQNVFDARGCGVGYTKYTRKFGARIDHILAGGQWKILGSKVHEGLGGDHRPITAVLRRVTTG